MTNKAMQNTILEKKVLDLKDFIDNNKINYSLTKEKIEELIKINKINLKLGDNRNSFGVYFDNNLIHELEVPVPCPYMKSNSTNNNFIKSPTKPPSSSSRKKRLSNKENKENDPYCLNSIFDNNNINVGKKLGTNSIFMPYTNNNAIQEINDNEDFKDQLNPTKPSFNKSNFQAAMSKRTFSLDEELGNDFFENEKVIQKKLTLFSNRNESYNINVFSADQPQIYLTESICSFDITNKAINEQNGILKARTFTMSSDISIQINKDIKESRNYKCNLININTNTFNIQDNSSNSYRFSFGKKHNEKDISNNKFYSKNKLNISDVQINELLPRENERIIVDNNNERDNCCKCVIF